MLNFPQNPALNQVYSFNGKTWIWNGQGWALAKTGNISADYFIGNGSLLTGLSASNVNANALIGTNLSSNVIYSSLQTVGNLSYLNVTGNVVTTGRFSGSGAGLTNIPGGNITGVVASASVATTVTASAQPNITSVGTLTSLSSTGNVTANYFIGNGSLLSGIAASSVNANALTGSTLSSNVLFSSLTTVGNLLSLNVVGNVVTTGRFIGSGAGLSNISAANIVGTVANAVYAVTAGTAYSVAGANVSGTVANAIYAVTAGNATTATVATYANIANSVSGSNVSGTVANAAYATTAGSATTANTAATVTTAAQPNITSVGTLTSVSVSGNATAGNVLTDGKISAVGNVTGNYFIGNGALLTGIVSNASANANALVGSTLSSNVLFSSLTTVGNLLSLNVDGNVVTTGRFSGSGAGLTNIPASNISGAVANAIYANTAGLATTATIANIAVTVTANAQPNITSVGTLTSVSVAGNASVGRLNFGQANLFLVNTSPAVLEIQADATQFSSNIDVANTIRTYSIVANGTASAIGNVIGGNLVTSGNATASYFVGNGRQLTGIVATSVGVLPSLSVTGNIVTGNINTSGIISAAGNIKTTGNVSGNYFIGNGSLLTGITVSAGTQITNGNSNVSVGANGNITVGVTGVSNVAVFTPTGLDITGNVATTGFVSATGNVTGGNIITVGKISTSGNVYGNAILSDHYYYANGTPVPTGITYTAASSPPSSPTVGDQWYDILNDVLYEFLNDGTSTYWVDSNSPAFAGGVVANVAISGTLLPVANVTYDVGSSTVYFRNTYTQNLYTNNRLPATNMPLGAVVQTITSPTLGGSITNSTSYADVSYANVTITPTSSTSKILILATGTSGFSSVAGIGITADTQLVRSPGTSLQIQSLGTSGSGGVGATGAISYSYLDSPGTTSAVTYKLQQKISNASSTLTSTNIWLIAMEIAAS
jgi:hypothetical protein